MDYKKPPVRPYQPFSVIVTHVDSPDQFYCQLKGKQYSAENSLYMLRNTQENYFSRKKFTI